MFNKILLVYSEKITSNHNNAVEKIKSLIEKEGKECNIAKVSDLEQNLFENIDLVVTVGGDGTFIRASHYLTNQLILGINSEPEISEGALTSMNENELDLLKAVLSGEYKVMKRERMEVIRNSIVLDKLALNDVYIGSLNQFHTSRYIIKFKDKEEEQRSSGVLISTSSGSNAWYKSAGGNPFDCKEELRFIVREPYFGRIFKPQLLQGEIKPGEKITFQSTRHIGGIIALDSDATYDFNLGDTAEIQISDKPLNVIVRK